MTTSCTNITSRFDGVIVLTYALCHQLRFVRLVVPRVAFITAILGIVLYISGKNVFSQILFPLFFLYFMIPVPHVSIESLVSFKLQL